MRFSCLSGNCRARTYAIGVSPPRNNHSEPANTTSPQSTLPLATNFELRKDLRASRKAGTRQAAAIRSQYGRDFLRVLSAWFDTLRVYDFKRPPAAGCGEWKVNCSQWQ